MLEKMTSIKRHLIKTLKHKSISIVTSLKSSRSLTDWGSSTATNKPDEKVTRAELLYSLLIAEHNLSIATEDNAEACYI